MPHGPFDLIVISEIAYYLRLHELAHLGKRIATATARHGKIVLLHHRRHFQDAAQAPNLAHLRLQTHSAALQPQSSKRNIRVSMSWSCGDGMSKTTGDNRLTARAPNSWERPSRTRAWLIIADRWGGRYTAR